MFNFKFKTGINKNYNYSDKTCYVKFIESSKINNELSEVEKHLNISLPKNQKAFLLNKKNSELKSYSALAPGILYLIKYDLAKLNSDFFRNYLSIVIENIKNDIVSDLIIRLPNYEKVKSLFIDEDYFLQSSLEGILLGNYNFEYYKSEKEETKNLSVIIENVNSKDLNKISNEAKFLIDSVNFTRDLVNEPAVTLTPQEFSKRTKNELQKYGVKVDILNVTELKKKKMNSILAVGKGSENPPQLMIIRYNSNKKNIKRIALVGKGVTYDTGGYSIKPTAGMIEMSADMAGAGTVVGIIRAVAIAKLPVEIIGIIPAVENMISGSSYKPGDIIRSYSGKTIEVKDTDAEGRIILADALTYASEFKPDLIIDMATLTGAVAIALGLFTAGVFGKDDETIDFILKSSEKTYEKVWRLPFWDEFHKSLESNIADISNLGTRWGGAITAGKFLEYFVPKEIKYVHLDLAGPALKNDSTNYNKKWDTGFGVRLFYDFLKNNF